MFRFMFERRIGTIQSFRPGYAGPYAPISAIWQATRRFSTAERPAFSQPHEEWHGQQGSNLRPAVLETAALPTELCPFTRFGAGAS
ncbi:hypothetical protein MPLB_510004 [Mesorhizobium sp. ORS 3324]|nr:hypothetical protein MPLB_510004 [Mesorhizobium sp. ORS 3324]